MDIGSGTGYPSANLSNFHPHAFTIDGIACASMEGFFAIFNALSENKSFQRALLATNNATLTHSIGKNKISETVLTKQEFCQRLTKIRERLKDVKNTK